MNVKLQVDEAMSACLAVDLNSSKQAYIKYLERQNEALREECKKLRASELRNHTLIAQLQQSLRKIETGLTYRVTRKIKKTPIVGNIIVSTGMFVVGSIDYYRYIRRKRD